MELGLGGSDGSWSGGGVAEARGKIREVCTRYSPQNMVVGSSEFSDLRSHFVGTVQ